ncbi:MAG: GNAT family N-acetyltransferase [Crocinitomicaceae bacterium]|nr:GNAT family N-acetyltransferase [Crocinitomicaceae bacterium]
MILRKATSDDIKLIFDWANDIEVRKNAFNQDPIAYEDHKKWFNNKLEEAHSFIYILEVNNVPAGQIRFDLRLNSWYIDYSVSVSFRSQNLGEYLIRLGISHLSKELNYRGEEIIGEVKKENIASQKTFIRCGFDKLENEGAFIFKQNPKLQNYVVVSSKDWNQNLTTDLKSTFDQYNFHYIKHKSSFDPVMLKAIKPKMVFIPHWSFIIPKEIFSEFECIIFHMTDLPYGRGGSPLQNLIVRGHKKTKISAIRCVEELDAGPIFAKVDLDLSGSAQEIFERANTKIEEIIRYIIVEKPLPVEQTGEVVTFKRRTPEMSNLKDVSEIEKVYDYIRMMDAEGYPKAFLETENLKIEFENASLKGDSEIIANVRIIKK